MVTSPPSDESTVGGDARPTRHDPVVDRGSEVELWLPTDPVAASQARRFIHERWTQLSEDALDDVVLIVTELVSNAVRHGAPDIVLRLRVEPFAVDVAVLDHGAELPPRSVTPVPHTATSGRGLAIIDRLAASWGVEPFEDRVGKSVWASIATTS